jgi:hypothetical protein
MRALLLLQSALGLFTLAAATQLPALPSGFQVRLFADRNCTNATSAREFTFTNEACIADMPAAGQSALFHLCVTGVDHTSLDVFRSNRNCQANSTAGDPQLFAFLVSPVPGAVSQCYAPSGSSSSALLTTEAVAYKAACNERIVDAEPTLPDVYTDQLPDYLQDVDGDGVSAASSSSTGGADDDSGPDATKEAFVIVCIVLLSFMMMLVVVSAFWTEPCMYRCRARCRRRTEDNDVSHL